MILADTSVWVDHLRVGVAELAAALEERAVCIHPFVVGELACGNLKRRDELLSLLSQLPQTHAATDAEVLAFVERRALMGRGIGLVDVHLLAAASLSDDVQLWTRDKLLDSVARELGLASRHKR